MAQDAFQQEAAALRNGRAADVLRLAANLHAIGVQVLEGKGGDAIDGFRHETLPHKFRPHPVTGLEFAGLPIDAVQPAAQDQRGRAFEIGVQHQLFARDPLGHHLPLPRDLEVERRRFLRPRHPRAQLRQRFVHGLDDFLRVFHARRANGQAFGIEGLGKIEQEWKLIRGKLKEYLDQQKELVASLREGLAKIGKEELAEDTLGVVIGDFKVTSQDRGEQILTLLRDFQCHLGVFLNEQRQVNGELQRLVDIGESLRLEDLRCLEIARARQDRKMDRELRREDIERLLAHFRQERQVNRRH